MQRNDFKKLFFISILLFVFPWFIPPVAIAENLGGLEKCERFSLIVEDVSQETEKFGFSRKWIEETIELKLRTARLPLENSTKPSIDVPALYVRVTGLNDRGGFIYNILITFKDSCISLRTRKLLPGAEVYRVDSLGVLGSARLREFRSILEEEIDRFVLDFLRVNKTP